MELKSGHTSGRGFTDNLGQRLDDGLDVGWFDLVFPPEFHKDIGFGFAGLFIAVVVDELEVGKGAALCIL